MENAEQILREMREDIEKGNVPLWADFGSETARDYVARLEAAIKRDREAAGNAAKMRDALAYVRHLLCHIDLGGDPCKSEVYAIACNALAAPPRNCDLYKTLDDARNAFFADYVPDETSSSATAFAIWLFDEAKGETK